MLYRALWIILFFIGVIWLFAQQPHRRSENVRNGQLSEEPVADPTGHGSKGQRARNPRTVVRSPANTTSDHSPPLTRIGDDSRITGMVVDSTGKAVPNALVELTMRRSRKYLPLETEVSGAFARVYTEEDATFSVEVPLGIAFDVYVTASPQGAAGHWSAFAGDHLKITLAESCRVHGRITGEDDLPIADVQVRGLYLGFPPTVVADVVSDAEGRYDMNGLPYLPKKFLIAPVPPSHVVPKGRTTVLKPGEAVGFDFKLQSGVKINGSVTDALTGHPVPNAIVGVGWYQEKQTTTDRFGRYELAGCGPDTQIRAKATGYESAQRPIVADTLTLDFQLNPAVTYSGQLVDHAGVGVSEADVHAYWHRADSGDVGLVDRSSTKTQESGAFNVCARRSCPCTLVVEKTGYARMVIDLPFENTGQTVNLRPIRVPRGCTVRGVVADLDGDKVARARVQLRGFGKDRFMLVSTARPEPALARYVELATMESNDKGEFYFDSVAPGNFTLRAEDALGNAEAKVVIQSDTRLALILGSENTIAGRVIGDKGRAIQSAHVILYPRGNLGKRKRRFTDSQGYFAAQGLVPEETYDVIVSPDFLSPGEKVGATRVTGVEVGTVDLQITVERCAAIQGIVTNNRGQPVHEAVIAADDDLGRRLATSYSDERGEFELCVSSDMYAWVYTFITRTADGEIVKSDKYTVSAGAKVTLVIPE